MTLTVRWYKKRARVFFPEREDGAAVLGKCALDRSSKAEQGGIAARAQVCVFSEQGECVFVPFSIRLYRELNGPVAGLLGTRN